MALSPAHKLGQIIGNVLEKAVYEPLSEIAEDRKIYLDYAHARPARSKRKKVTWTDSYGNAHDLDYVLEDGGSENQFGTPCAFIEVAWRRYTKHSRNKAQEIQGAVLPLVDKFAERCPFFGVVLAGEFTDGALNQLRSRGFELIYCPYESIIDVFRKFDVDVASSESSSDKELWKKVQKVEKLSEACLYDISMEIISSHFDQFDSFFSALKSYLNREIDKIIVHGVYHSVSEFNQMSRVKELFSSIEKARRSLEFRGYEVRVQYTNGNETCVGFCDRRAMLDYLKTIQR